MGWREYLAFLGMFPIIMNIRHFQDKKEWIFKRYKQVAPPELLARQGINIHRKGISGDQFSPVGDKQQLA